MLVSSRIMRNFIHIHLGFHHWYCDNLAITLVPDSEINLKDMVTIGYWVTATKHDKVRTMYIILGWTVSVAQKMQNAMFGDIEEINLSQFIHKQCIRPLY